MRATRSLQIPRHIREVYGGGGRASNNGLTVTVFGANGFIGKYLMQELGGCGTRVYAPFRCDDMEVRALKPMFDLGQLGLMPFSSRDRESIRKALYRSDVVVNLIGQWYETKNVIPRRGPDGKLSWSNYSFQEVHADVAGAIAEAARDAGVRRFIHVSSVTASEASASKWSRSKDLGEKRVREVLPEAVIVRLNAVFGAEDKLLNYIAEASSRLGFFPLLEQGSAVLQPVHVHDVARGLHRIVEDVDEFRGETFELSGPADYTYKELAEYVQDVTLMKKPLVDVPTGMARTAGKLLDKTLSPFWTEDAVNRVLEGMRSTGDQSLLTFKDLEMDKLGTVDRNSFDYLHRFRFGGHFQLARGYH